MKRKAWRPKVSILDFAMLSWESQVCQYPPFGEPGVSYFPGPLPSGNVVDCLLWRDEGGTLRGILNHFPFKSKWEEIGNVNIWVQPGHRGRGIATALLDEAERRWDIDFAQQRYSADGAAFVERYLRRVVGPS